MPDATTNPGSWVDAEANPKLIRSYDHPTDGRYLLGADVAAWLRDLSATASESSAMGALYAPLLKRMADTVTAMTEPDEGDTDG